MSSDFKIWIITLTTVSGAGFQYIEHSNRSHLSTATHKLFCCSIGWSCAAGHTVSRRFKLQCVHVRLWARRECKGAFANGATLHCLMVWRCRCCLVNTCFTRNASPNGCQNATRAALIVELTWEQPRLPLPHQSNSPGTGFALLLISGLHEVHTHNT